MDLVLTKNAGGKVELPGFPCVRIIVRDLVSQGPQVARLVDRSYVGFIS